MHGFNYFKIYELGALFVKLDVMEEIRGFKEEGIVVVDRDYYVFCVR